jgi:hypothetical protein
MKTQQISIDEKKRFFKSANTNFGLSALCLSGGASFGYCKLIIGSQTPHTVLLKVC